MLRNNIKSGGSQKSGGFYLKQFINLKRSYFMFNDSHVSLPGQGCRNPGIDISDPGDSWDIPGYPFIPGYILIPGKDYACLYG